MRAARQRLLTATADRLTAWSRRGRTLDVIAEFAADEAGFVAFEAYVLRHLACDFALLADVADEEFELHEIPPVRGRHRRALIARKLDQAHAETPLKAAIGCGHAAEGRRDERLLFAALVPPPAMTRWLHILERSKAAIEGLHLLAQLVERLPTVLALPLQHRVVVTVTRAGLRQTVLENGRLRFSRLTPIASEADAPAACAAELVRLKRYLAGHMPASATEIPVTILASRRARDRYRESCSAVEGVCVECLDLREESSRAGLRQAPSGFATEALFLQLMMQQRHAEQLAPPSLRQHYAVRRMERVLHGGAIAVFAAGLAVGGLGWTEATTMRERGAVLAADLEAETRRYQARLGALPDLPLKAAELRAVIDRHEDLQRRSPRPADSFRLIGGALADFPQVHVERLDWALDTEHRAVVELHATLSPVLAADPRTQLAIVNEFVRRLEAGAAARVQILAAPFDADPAKPLPGDATARRPKLSLRIAWRDA